MDVAIGDGSDLKPGFSCQSDIVTAVKPATTFGIILEEGGVATGFSEKPQLDVIINGGFFVCA